MRSWMLVVIVGVVIIGEIATAFVFGSSGSSAGSNGAKKDMSAEILMAFLGLDALIYLAYCLGAVGQITASNFSRFVEDVMGVAKNPLPIRFTGWTKTYLLMFVMLWFITVAYIASNKHEYMKMKEYGTAKFISPEEFNKKYRSKDDNNKILSQKARISRDGRFTMRNNNMLVQGGSGAGKTMFLVTPNLLASVKGKPVTQVYTDPKGEILRDNGNYLKVHGKNIIVFDLINMMGHYNPIKYIRKSTDVIKLITNLIQNTTPKGASKGDPFWEKAEGMFLMSLLYYVWMVEPKHKRNFRSVMDLLKIARIPEDEDDETELDKKMYELDENHPARLSYEKVRRGAVDTVRSIIISANSRLAFLQDESILKMLDYDEINIPELGRGVGYDSKKSSALFLVIPDSDTTYNFVVGMLYTQIFQELYYQADFECGGRLPVPVEVWFDEFANIALPDGFIQLLSTMRSREISANIIIQFNDQVTALFEKLKNGIKANCDTFVYLGANDEESQKEISQRLGKRTVEKASTSQSKGRNGSFSQSNDVLGRELMLPDEVALIGDDKEIVFVRGSHPVLDTKFKPFKTKEFIESRKLGHYDPDPLGLEAKEEEVKILSEAEANRLKRMNDEGDISLKEISLSPEIIMNMDIAALVKAEEEKAMSVEEAVAEAGKYREELLESAKTEEEARERMIAAQKTIDQKRGKVAAPVAEKDPSKVSSELENSIEERIAKHAFSPEQMEQAMKGMSAGLSEETILKYFRPEIPAERMEYLRRIAELGQKKGQAG